MVFTTLTSVPTASITQLKQPYCISMIQWHSCLVFLCLLDLSAAFDTIDHNILISRLSSWFEIHGSVLNWFKSYLTSRSFRVKCDKDFSSEHVFGPLLFVMYTTPLSTLISSFSLNFFSFHLRNFDSSIAHLQTALKHIYHYQPTQFSLIGNLSRPVLYKGHELDPAFTS